MLNYFFSKEDGYYTITKSGTVALIVLLIAVILISAFLVDRKQRTAKMSTKQLVFSAMALALAYIASSIKLFKLPYGGSITLFSMFFVTIIGYWYGIKAGLLAAFAYSLLQFMQDGGAYILSPFQACCDYFFAFTALGLSGLFYNTKNGMIKGYIVAVFIRALFNTIGGYIYWMDYMPEDFPKSISFLYPVVYNYGFVLAEAIITVIILLLPPVRQAIAYSKKTAC